MLQVIPSAVRAARVAWHAIGFRSIGNPVPPPFRARPRDVGVLPQPRQDRRSPRTGAKQLLTPAEVGEIELREGLLHRDDVLPRHAGAGYPAH